MLTDYAEVTPYGQKPHQQVGQGLEKLLCLGFDYYDRPTLIFHVKDLFSRDLQSHPR